ncbi:hypothetical protein [Marinilactibacillus psychrotolerans]|uniref:hypothetical protein n=1 Tax=Marinilactibacillus psychrotolerans TaxID=191770 RepID=UPI0039AF5299
MKNEEGSILISTLLFVSVTAMLIGGISRVISTQITQLNQIHYSYEARSMISMTETILTKEFEDSQKLKNGKVKFNKGEVKISKQSDKRCLLEVSLTDIKYTLTEEYVLDKRE